MRSLAGSILKNAEGATFLSVLIATGHKRFTATKTEKHSSVHIAKKQFSVKAGTIYENSNIPLQKWVLNFYLISLSKKGIGSIELSKTIGVTQKSAWYLLHKIRYMLEHRNSDNQLRETVEVDETYVGGKKKG